MSLPYSCCNIEVPVSVIDKLIESPLSNPDKRKVKNPLKLHKKDLVPIACGSDFPVFES